MKPTTVKKTQIDLAVVRLAVLFIVSAGAVTGCGGGGGGGSGNSGGGTSTTLIKPVITWATPAAITCGQTLSSAQLNATANVAGTFSYSPAAGTLLAGGEQTLTAVFTPTDTTKYSTATATASVNVLGAAASVMNYKYSDWNGNWTFNANTLVTTGSVFTNPCPLIYQTANEPVSSNLTAVTPTYYYGAGLLSFNNGITINNTATGTIQAIATGDAGASTVGLWALSAATINNSGLIDAKVLSTDGSPLGISTYNGGGAVTITNAVGGTISATGPYAPQAVQMSWTGAQKLYNYGKILATSTGATNDPNPTGYQSYPIAINSFVANTDAPVYIENNGLLSTSAQGKTHVVDGKTISDLSNTITMWNNHSDVTIVNNGAVLGVDTAQANGVYFGANNANVNFKNTGSWVSQSKDPSNVGEMNVWLENDGGDNGTTGTMTFENSGVLASNASFALSIAGYGKAPWGSAYFTNSGTIVGGWLGIGWPGDVYFNNSGDILTALAWIGATNAAGQPVSNVQAVISGLPTINPVLSASENGTNTLTFNLTGTLQYVNGVAASGSSLAPYNPGSTGSIVVSGKTYKWAHFGTVTGTFTPAVTLAAGPTGLSASVVSNTTATLGWSKVTGASAYNVKRAVTSTGPYTTFGKAITETSYTDATAYASVDDYYYVVSAIVGGVETANSAEVALNHKKVTGTSIGTASTSNPIGNAFDSNLTTYYEGPDANNDWVGLDLGASATAIITRVGYTPRYDYASRMVGGVIQGANSADFSNAVTLYTITDRPIAGILTMADIANAASYRYVRYLGPSGSHSDVAELQFYHQ